MKQRSVKSIAYRVICLSPDLSGKAKVIAACLVDHYNVRTNQCDPGINSLSNRADISERTVIRAVKELENHHLVVKVRHGGKWNKNSYAPNWKRFAELDERLNVKSRFPRNISSQTVSRTASQTWHTDGDKIVTQTLLGNHFKRTHASSTSVAARGTDIRHVSRIRKPMNSEGKPSRDAAWDAAEKRWNISLNDHLRTYPDTYAVVIEALTEADKAEATAAEMDRRGSGIHVIFRRLREARGHVSLPLPSPPRESSQ